MQAVLGTLALRTLAFRTLTRCLVCGFAEVRTDEVVDRGIVFLAECPRCEHRWTSRAPLAPQRTPQRTGASTKESVRAA
jgi:hypothetical protein